MQEENYRYKMRQINSRDDDEMAKIIRLVMPEFGACGPGYAINDPEVDRMFEAYQSPGAQYYIIEDNGKVVGGGGFGPLSGCDSGYCELQKMYFLKEARGKGWGRKLLQKCLAEAKKSKYLFCYIETLEGMQQAKKLYVRNGFQKLTSPMGNTGHFSCNSWYLKKL